MRNTETDESFQYLSEFTHKEGMKSPPREFFVWTCGEWKPTPFNELEVFQEIKFFQKGIDYHFKVIGPHENKRGYSPLLPVVTNKNKTDLKFSKKFEVSHLGEPVHVHNVYMDKDGFIHIIVK